MNLIVLYLTVRSYRLFPKLCFNHFEHSLYYKCVYHRNKCHGDVGSQCPINVSGL